MSQYATRLDSRPLRPLRLLAILTAALLATFWLLQGILLIASTQQSRPR